MNYIVSSLHCQLNTVRDQDNSNMSRIGENSEIEGRLTMDSLISLPFVFQTSSKYPDRRFLSRWCTRCTGMKELVDWKIYCECTAKYPVNIRM